MTTVNSSNQKIVKDVVLWTCLLIGEECLSDECPFGEICKYGLGDTDDWFAGVDSVVDAYLSESKPNASASPETVFSVNGAHGEIIGIFKDKQDALVAATAYLYDAQTEDWDGKCMLSYKEALDCLFTYDAVDDVVYISTVEIGRTYPVF